MFLPAWVTSWVKAVIGFCWTGWGFCTLARDGHGFLGVLRGWPVDCDPGKHGTSLSSEPGNQQYFPFFDIFWYILEALIIRSLPRKVKTERTPSTGQWNRFGFMESYLTVIFNHVWDDDPQLQVLSKFSEGGETATSNHRAPRNSWPMWDASFAPRVRCESYACVPASKKMVIFRHRNIGEIPGDTRDTLWLCQNSYWKWPLK